MKTLLTLALLLTAVPQQAAKPVTLSGHLMPFKCQHDEKVSHTRDCALRAECKITGYGIGLADGTFQQFDEEGNKKALELLTGTTKASDLQVEATGERVDTLFHVTTLRLK